ncbi:Retrovirus-related Pol polyprotein from type-1 retrotransposable element R1, partial [Aphis craccivora]
EVNAGLSTCYRGEAGASTHVAGSSLSDLVAELRPSQYRRRGEKKAVLRTFFGKSTMPSVAAAAVFASDDRSTRLRKKDMKKNEIPCGGGICGFCALALEFSVRLADLPTTLSRAGDRRSNGVGPERTSRLVLRHARRPSKRKRCFFTDTRGFSHPPFDFPVRSTVLAFYIDGRRPARSIDTGFTSIRLMVIGSVRATRVRDRCQNPGAVDDRHICGPWDGPRISAQMGGFIRGLWRKSRRRRHRSAGLAPTGVGATIFSNSGGGWVFVAPVNFSSLRRDRQTHGSPDTDLERVARKQSDGPKVLASVVELASVVDLASVVESQLLYAAPVWGDRVRASARSVSHLVRAQRLIALRVIRAYRTVSDEAALLLAGMPPADLLALERGRLKERFGSTPLPGQAPISKDSIRRSERSTTLDLWQRRWLFSNKGMWTKSPAHVPHDPVFDCSRLLSILLEPHGEGNQSSLCPVRAELAERLGDRLSVAALSKIICGPAEEDLPDVPELREMATEEVTEDLRLLYKLVENLLSAKEEDERVRQGATAQQ